MLHARALIVYCIRGWAGHGRTDSLISSIGEPTINAILGSQHLYRVSFTSYDWKPHRSERGAVVILLQHLTRDQ